MTTLQHCCTGRRGSQNLGVGGDSPGQEQEDLVTETVDARNEVETQSETLPLSEDGALASSSLLPAAIPSLLSASESLQTESAAPVLAPAVSGQSSVSPYSLLYLPLTVQPSFIHPVLTNQIF